MRLLGYILSSGVFIAFAACSGGGSASDYFTPGITTTPPTLEAAEGEVREAFTAISTYSYGQVSAPVNATFTLKNSGDYAAKLTRTSFGSDQFSFLGGSYPGTGGTCTTTVRSKASCTIVVRFAPQANQSITALMSLFYDSKEGETSLDILLSGSGGSTPTVSSVSPTSGLVAGGTTITISGSGFLAGLSITFGGSACSSISVVSSSRVTCVSPSHASGGVNVVVTNTDGERATYANGFFYVTAPALTAIADQTVNENAAITQVNANDGGDDFDGDGDAITYTCYYDATVDGAVADTSLCSTLSGVSFNNSSGVMDWTPSYAQAGAYEFKITGNDSTLSDAEIFAVTVANVNRAPSLANIANQSLNENVAITQVNAEDGGDDFDADSEAITYTCYYDTNVDGAVAASTTCASLTGVNFAAATGVMDWTPSYSQSGSYEFKVTGSDGSLSDNKMFSMTVANVNRAPSIAAISDQSVSTGAAITQVNANDGGDDFDVDSDAITYTCYYDTTADGSVANSTLCSTLGALSFNTSTGVLDWTPGSAGTFEMKITGGDGSLSDDELLVITVSVASGWVETKISASDGAVSDYFGKTVSISGTIGIVGSHGDANDIGAAYIYQFDPSTNAWAETKLTASDGATGDAFGIGVAVSGTTAIVGASGAASDHGAVYIYRLDPTSNSWHETKLTASDGEIDDSFGYSVGISGSTAIVGAQGDGNWVGAAYIYQFDPSSNTWTETKLTASNGGALHAFGVSVGISGTTAIVGATGAASENGAAYVYRLDPSSNTWTETQLSASDGSLYDNFGTAVAISGTTAIVGASSEGAANRGAAYIYRYDPSSNTWAETKLTASDSSDNSYYGNSVAISGTTGIVGAYFSGAGSAYLYRYDPSSYTWAETELNASDGAAMDQFGVGVAVSGTTAIVGSFYDGGTIGSAYIYKGLIPSAETKLTASDRANGDQFGFSVGISETTVIAGAYIDEGTKGAAYLYQFDPSSSTWMETKLTASDGVGSDVFGYSVAISGTRAIVGARGDNSNSGAAYLYEYDPSSNAWLETKLIASDGANDDYFGHAVGISGNMAIVGAIAAGGVMDLGAAYIYRFDPSSNTWTETKLMATDGLSLENFGISVSISGTIAAVGKVNSGGGEGSYIYEYDPSSNSWRETKVTPSDGVSGFGVSVSVSGTSVVVGARAAANYTGAAYIFRLDPSSNTWAETKIAASDGTTNDFFGQSVYISETTVVVGAPCDGWVIGGAPGACNSNNSGAAYVYRLDPSSNTWVETKVAASDGSAGDYYGSVVMVSGRSVIIGAPREDSNAGAVYLYSID